MAKRRKARYEGREGEQVMRQLRRAAVAAGVALAMLAGVLGVEQAVGNLHEVVPGVMFRSGQLGAERLGRVAEEYGIRSVLN